MKRVVLPKRRALFRGTFQQPEDAMRLEGKSIIITGASSGIGAAAAKLFGEEGASLVLGARREAELEAVAAAVNRAGGRATAMAGDVRDPDFAGALVDRALEACGGLDGAFNNAGIVGSFGAVPETSLADWHEVLDVNLTAAFLAARAQIPALRARGGGSIVFTSSFVGYSNAGLPGMAAYAASKAGINGLVQSLAAEHARENVRVTALMPGGTVTALGGEGDPATLDFVAGLHPMRRMADPREIAEAALFLLSDASRFVTGSPMIVDGGMSVRLL